MCYSAYIQSNHRTRGAEVNDVLAFRMSDSYVSRDAMSGTDGALPR